MGEADNVSMCECVHKIKQENTNGCAHTCENSSDKLFNFSTKYNSKEGNILFNERFNTFYLRLYGIRYMVKYHSCSERGNPLPPHGLLFLISSKVSFIHIIPQTG